jgi:WD40 repeat protein
VTGKVKATLQSTEAETAMCLEWLPGGKRVAIGTTIGDVLIWNAETDKVDRRIRAHVHGVEWLSVSRDGTRVMTAGHEGNIGLWDIATGQRLAWFAKAHDGGGVLGVSIHPDGRSAASCGQDGIVRLWRLPDQFVDPKKK